LLTIGPARVFLNEHLHTYYADVFSYVAIQCIPLELPLKKGLNTLYLHGEMLGWHSVYAFSTALAFAPALTLAVSLLSNGSARKPPQPEIAIWRCKPCF
jgi:hypothetical protein